MAAAGAGPSAKEIWWPSTCRWWPEAAHAPCCLRPHRCAPFRWYFWWLLRRSLRDRLIDGDVKAGDHRDGVSAKDKLGWALKARAVDQGPRRRRPAPTVDHVLVGAPHRAATAMNSRGRDHWWARAGGARQLRAHGRRWPAKNRLFCGSTPSGSTGKTEGGGAHHPPATTSGPSSPSSGSSTLRERPTSTGARRRGPDHRHSYIVYGPALRRRHHS